MRSHGECAFDLVNDLAAAFVGGAQLVVCDLTTATPTEAETVEMLLPVARYLSSWPGAGVVVVAPSGSEARAALSNLSRPETLVVSASADLGVEQLSWLPVPDTIHLQLGSRQTSARTSRQFVVQALLDWGLISLIASATLVVSELVTNAVVHAASKVDITLGRTGSRVQIMVRDHGIGTPKVQFDDPHDHVLSGRGLLLVQASSSAWGVFTGLAAGKTVWAVFDAAETTSAS